MHEVPADPEDRQKRVCRLGSRRAGRLQEPGHIFPGLANGELHPGAALRRPLVHVLTDTAWVSCVEHVTSAIEGDFITSLVSLVGGNRFARVWLRQERSKRLTCSRLILCKAGVAQA